MRHEKLIFGSFQLSLFVFDLWQVWSLTHVSLYEIWTHANSYCMHTAKLKSKKKKKKEEEREEEKAEDWVTQLPYIPYLHGWRPGHYLNSPAIIRHCRQLHFSCIPCHQILFSLSISTKQLNIYFTNYLCLRIRTLSGSNFSIQRNAKALKALTYNNQSLEMQRLRSNNTNAKN